MAPMMDKPLVCSSLPLLIWLAQGVTKWSF